MLSTFKLARQSAYQSRHPIYRITQDAVSDRPQRLPKAQCYRALILQLKNWRRIATRYDRLAQNYMAALALAAVVIAWINESPT